MYDDQILSLNSTAKDINDITFTDYYYRLMLLARSVFKWEALPPEIDEKWIERYLFHEGKCMFFKDESLGFMVAKFTNSGGINYYDEPTLLTPVATNYSAFLSETGRDIRGYINGEECVLIRNNDIMIPTRRTILMYAYRIAEIQRTIDINIQAQQTPVLVTGSDKQKLSLMQVYKKWKGHEPIIFGDKALEDKPLGVLKTEAPIVFDKLQIQKHAVFNEVMTFLGINNANQDKRERLVAGEVQANNEQIEMSAYCMLKSRKLACEQINRMFGTKISVKLRSLDEIREIEEKSKKDVKKTVEGGGEDD